MSWSTCRSDHGCAGSGDIARNGIGAKKDTPVPINAQNNTTAPGPNVRRWATSTEAISGTCERPETRLANPAAEQTQGAASQSGGNAKSRHGVRRLEGIAGRLR